MKIDLDDTDNLFFINWASWEPLISVSVDFDHVSCIGIKDVCQFFKYSVYQSVRCHLTPIWIDLNEQDHWSSSNRAS